MADSNTGSDPTAEQDWMTEDDEEENDVLSTFTVDDDEKAEWCLQKIQEADRIQKKWLDFYEDQIRHVKDRHNRTCDRMHYYLRRYLVLLREKGLVKSTKTMDRYVLPSGVLTLKHGAWDYSRNDPELLDWLRGSGMNGYIKESVKYSPMWGDLKKLTTTDDAGHVIVRETGEIVGGVRAVMAPDSFIIE